MDELIQRLKSEVGLDDQKAQSAAQTVLDFLKKRLPAPLSSEVDSVLTGKGAAGAAEKISEMFGKKTA